MYVCIITIMICLACRAWWSLLIIPTLRKWKQENAELKASLDYILETPSVKKRKEGGRERESLNF